MVCLGVCSLSTPWLGIRGQQLNDGNSRGVQANKAKQKPNTVTHTVPEPAMRCSVVCVRGGSQRGARRGKEGRDGEADVTSARHRRTVGAGQSSQRGGNGGGGVYNRGGVGGCCLQMGEEGANTSSRTRHLLGCGWKFVLAPGGPELGAEPKSEAQKKKTRKLTNTVFLKKISTENQRKPPSKKIGTATKFSAPGVVV